MQCWCSLNIPATVLSAVFGCGQWFLVHYSQGCAVVCPVNGFLVTLEGDLLGTDNHMFGGQKRCRALSPQASMPSQNPFDDIRCDVDGFPQFIFGLKKWFRAGCTCWCLLIPEVTLLSPNVWCSTVLERMIFHSLILWEKSNCFASCSSCRWLLFPHLFSRYFLFFRAESWWGEVCQAIAII